MHWRKDALGCHLPVSVLHIILVKMRILQDVQARSRAFCFQGCSIFFFFKKAHVNLPSSDGVWYFTQVQKLLHAGSFNYALVCFFCLFCF